MYHSKHNDVTNCKTTCKASVLPLKSGSVKGPAGEFSPQNEKDMDVVDEALTYFRANILFSQFEVEGGADLTLVYLTAWIADCLRKLQKEKTKVTIIVHASSNINKIRKIAYRKQQRRQHQTLEKIKSLRFQERISLNLEHFSQNQRIIQKSSYLSIISVKFVMKRLSD